jgi:hypothetical protein
MSDGPDDGGSKDLWNIGSLQPDYTALQPRRRSSLIKKVTRRGGAFKPRLLGKQILYFLGIIQSLQTYAAIVP